MQRSLRFDALIKRFLYKPKKDETTHHITRPKEASIGEQLANTQPLKMRTQTTTVTRVTTDTTKLSLA
jgi:hypothetical protein